MTRMSKGENIEPNEQEVYRWLELRGIPQQYYENLSPSVKDIQRNLVCTPTRLTSPGQRKDLYQKLCLREMIAGRGPVDGDYLIPPDDELRKFFSPLTPAERLHDLYKY